MSRRRERLEQELRDEVALIVRTLKDPRVQWVTVTRAEVTPDLEHARIFFGVLGDEEARRKATAGLRSASGFVRRELGQRLRLRLTPEVRFEYDKGLDAADRVARILEEVKPAEEPSSGSEAPAADAPDDPGDGPPDRED